MAVPRTGPIIFQFGNTHEESVPVIGAISPRDLDELEDENAESEDLTSIPRRAAPALFPRRISAPAPRLTAKTLLEQAKDRILELDLELASMAGLQAERDALHRMVSASENPSS